MSTTTNLKALACGEDGCELPLATKLGPVLCIKAHHHGREHTTWLTVDDLRQLIDKLERRVVVSP